MAPHRFVDTEAELSSVVEQLLVQPRYALDTEFHRERPYWPKVALVQIAWPGDLVLIDEEDRRYFKQQEIQLYRKLPAASAA